MPFGVMSPARVRNEKDGLPAGTVVAPPYFIGVYLGGSHIVMKLGYKVIPMNPNDVVAMSMKDYPAVVKWNGGDVSETFAIIEKDVKVSPFVAVQEKSQVGMRMALYQKYRDMASALAFPPPAEEEVKEEVKVKDKKTKKVI